MSSIINFICFQHNFPRRQFGCRFYGRPTRRAHTSRRTGVVLLCRIWGNVEIIKSWEKLAVIGFGPIIETLLNAFIIKILIYTPAYEYTNDWFYRHGVSLKFIFKAHSDRLSQRNGYTPKHNTQQNEKKNSIKWGKIRECYGAKESSVSWGPLALCELFR